MAKTFQTNPTSDQWGDIVLFSRCGRCKTPAGVLIDGIITLLLGLLIYLQWPSSFAWVIGVGRGGMIISGMTSIML